MNNSYLMAPSRADRSPSPVPAHMARAPTDSQPLPKGLIRQIQKHVASSGRSLQRLEISGRVIENFDNLEGSDSEHEPASPVVASAAGVLDTRTDDDDLPSLNWLQNKNLLQGRVASLDGVLDTRPGDDDLPSLNWLQNKNLLQGFNMNGEVRSNSNKSSQAWSSPSWSPPREPSAPAKPPYSFSCLIFMAIEAAPTRALPVKEIYAWIVKHFPYFRDAPPGWKNSVRHNLSLNKCFKKVDKAPTLGKGSLWTIDPQHRGNLVQAFGRAPVPPPAVSPVSTTLPTPEKGSPDPKLFPYLARRLAGTQPEPPGRDEYLAAAGVLAMKYGPDVYTKLPLVISEPGQEHIYTKLEYDDDRFQIKKEYNVELKEESDFEARHPVENRYYLKQEFKEEADYEERSTAEALLNLAGITPPSPPRDSNFGPIRFRTYRRSTSPYR